MSIPSYQIFLWIILIAAKLVLFAVLLVGRGKRYPAFTAFVGASGIGSVGLYLVNAAAGSDAYFWAYWSKQSIDAGFMLWMIYEIFYDQFHPVWTMPRRTRDTAIYIFVPAVVCATAAIALSPSSFPECFLRTARMYSRAVSFNALLSVVAITVLSKYFMIPWLERTKGIVAGLTISLLVQSVTSVSNVSMGIAESQFLGTLRMLGDLTGVAGWLAMFSRPERDGYFGTRTKGEVFCEFSITRGSVALGIPYKKNPPPILTNVQREFLLEELHEQSMKGCDKAYGL